MRLIWIGGDHRRHFHYANALSGAADLVGAVVLKREAMRPEPPSDLSERDRKNFTEHFRRREAAEAKAFGEPELRCKNVLEVTQESLNSEKTAKFVEDLKADVCMVFGPKMIKGALFKALPPQTLNLHLGLSPRYRGAATLFWPFYFLEPTYAGSTFHYLKDTPDSGDIVHQTLPDLKPGDGIHDVGARVVQASAEDAVKLLRILSSKGQWEGHPQKSSGKNFLEKDFRPEHLRVIYDLFNDRLVDEYLEGRLICPQPVTVSQFQPAQDQPPKEKR